MDAENRGKTVTRYQVIPASIQHVKTLSLDIEADYDARRVLHRLFMDSSTRRTIIVDGKPVAMWGVNGPLLADTAIVWLALGRTASKWPVSVVRCATAELKKLATRIGKLYAAIGENDASAIAFAEAIGFNRSYDFDPAEGFVGMEFRPLPDQPIGKIRAGEKSSSPYIIHGLGRSRTAWLAAFLSYGRWQCLHEQAMHLHSPTDLTALFERRRTGYAETAANFGWPLIRHARPDVRHVVVKRDTEDAIQAMIAHYRANGMDLDEESLAATFRKSAAVLQRISALPNTLTVAYNDLNLEEGCRSIFEFCLPYEWDRDWWLEMREKRIESDLGAIVDYYQRHRERIDHFKRTCKRELIRLVRASEISNAIG